MLDKYHLLDEALNYIECFPIYNIMLYSLVQVYDLDMDVYD